TRFSRDWSSDVCSSDLTATNLFTNLFFNPERYDLSKVGRLKLNFKFGLDEPIESQVLTKRDILETVRYLIQLKNGDPEFRIDDIDRKSVVQGKRRRCAA